MKVEIENSFIRDAKKVPKEIQRKLPEIIQILRDSKGPLDIPKIKKMAGYTNACRIRIADYRIG